MPVGHQIKKLLLAGIVLIPLVKTYDTAKSIMKQKPRRVQLQRQIAAPIFPTNLPQQPEEIRSPESTMQESSETRLRATSWRTLKRLKSFLGSIKILIVEKFSHLNRRKRRRVVSRTPLPSPTRMRR